MGCDVRGGLYAIDASGICDDRRWWVFDSVEWWSEGEGRGEVGFVDEKELVQVADFFWGSDVFVAE